MQEKRSHYPSYNVLKEKDHWDEHTREIVLKRLEIPEEKKYLTGQEAEMIYIIAKHIVYEERKQILNYIVKHLDDTLSSPTGESERKINTPEQAVLIRRGLKAIDKLACKQHGQRFINITTEQQAALLSDLQLGKAAPLKEWNDVPQKELFKKLAVEIASAYYSHPTVWSEIGHGGPAYPRGYVRLERGLTDPWEAKRDAKQ